MGVLSEALQFLGLSVSVRPVEIREEFTLPRTRAEQRELAAAMRRLPGRFTDRLPLRTLGTIRDAAASGRWEHAVGELISVLDVHGIPLTDEDARELRAVLHALEMGDEPMAGLTYR